MYVMLTVSRASDPGGMHDPGSTRVQLLEDPAMLLSSNPVASLVSTLSARATAVQFVCQAMHEQTPTSFAMH
jgi:hypothetical protein